MALLTQVEIPRTAARSWVLDFAPRVFLSLFFSFIFAVLVRQLP